MPFSRFLLYLVIALTCFSGVRSFAAQQSNYPKACFTTNTTAPDGLYANDDTDVNAAQNYERAIYLLLEQESFAQLDCLADAARKNKDRFSNGRWKLAAIYEGVANTIEHGTNEDWNARLLHIQHWIASNPKSTTAQIAEAQLYAYLAWEARGDGLSDTVSDSGWKLFNERNAEAKRLLERSPELKQCPHWYSVMQQVALAQGWPVAQQRALLDQAVAFEPTYYPYYGTFSNAISTKWYGEDGDSERFVVEMADRMKDDEGDIITFEVAARSASCCETGDIMKRISFERIRRGYAALQKRYGTSFTNMNAMAFIAVRTDDAIYADSLLRAIGEQWDKKVWGSREDFEEQKRMTAQMVPMRQMQLSRHKAVDDNLKTAAGVRFKVALESRLRSSVQTCVDTAADAGDKFQILILLNKGGKLERAYPEPFSMVAQCLMAKLADYYGPHAEVLLVPPQDAYWMEVDVDPAVMAKKN